MLLHPPFPRSSGAFVDREHELGRTAELIGAEVLFLVYGLAGIGKSEFVYKAIEEARQTPRFRSAPALLLQAREGYRAEHLLSILRLRLRVRLGMDAANAKAHEGKSEPRLPQESAPSFAEDLIAVARMLEARPCLLFLDDLHHLDAAVGDMLGFLARHVRRSRVFVASRTELLLPADAPPPVLIRLQPLDVTATAELVSSLSRRMGIAGAAVDPGELFRLTGGSPFLIRRELAAPGSAERSGADGHDRTLGELSQESRLVLLLARVLRGRLTTQELEQTGLDSAAIWELSRRFLIDVERGVIIVHDLTWDALRPLWPEADLRRARREVAQLLARRCEADPARNAADGVDAVRQLSLVGDPPAAFEMLHRTYRAVAAAGLDHLLLDLFPSLRLGFAGEAGAEQRLALDLLAVRIHLRRSDIGRAQQILRSLEHLPSATSSLRYLRLAGEVCQRSGQLPEARQLFERAQAAARTPPDRFHVALLLANVSSLAGDGAQARAVLDAAASELAQLAPVEVARLGWSRSLSYLLEDRMAEAAAVAAETTARLSESGLQDASVLLAMHALIANAECDEVATARAMLDRILHHAAASGTLREQTAALYRGIVLYAEGDMPTARAALHEALNTLDSHHDYAPAAAAALYLGRTLLALGDIDGVLAATQRSVRLFRAAGLPGLAAHAELVQAQALVATLQLEPARNLAQRLMDLPRLPARLRLAAQAVMASVQLLLGQPPPLLDAVCTGTAQHAHVLDQAELALLAASPSEPSLRQLLERTEQTRQHYARAGRRQLEARACAALAGLHLACGSSDDLSQADALLARAQDLCMRHAYGLLHLRCVLLEAALQRRQGSERLARTTLRQGLDASGASEDGLELRLLRAAVEDGDGGETGPGLVTLLTALGLRSTRPYTIIDRRGRRDGDERERDRAMQASELIIDIDRGSIARRGGEAGISGRPLMASLLAALVATQAECASAEQLFYDVWGGREYHPLQHRNTIYVAITRLRQALRELLPGRDIIETTASGWRLARDVELCVISTHRANK